MIDTTSELRLCPRCNQRYPATLEYFGSNKSRPGGLAVYCRSCITTYNRQYRNRCSDTLKAQKSAYYSDLRADPVRWRERLSASRAWKKANRDKALPNDRTYRKMHRTERNAYNRNWRANNPQKARDGVRRYFKRKANLPRAFTDEDWRRALAYWNYQCAYCGVSEHDGYSLETEHYIPISCEVHNPGDVPWNVVPACRSCNATKHNKAPMDFLLSIYSEEEAQRINDEIRAYFCAVKGGSL